MNFNFDLTGALDTIEKSILRVAGALLGTIIIFIILSGILTNNMEKKEKEAKEKAEKETAAEDKKEA